ncbi:MAG: hypothetical protein AAFR31_20355 [Cyanobacteria bacterium J06627_8]
MVTGFKLMRHLTQAVALVSFLTIPTAVNAESVFIPGTSVTLEAPPGFTVADPHSVLEHVETGSSIIIAEFPPEAYSAILRLFTSETVSETAADLWESRGVTIDRLTWLTVDDREVPLLTGTQVTAEAEVTKYIALLEGENTILVTFNIMDPNQMTQDDAEMVMESIRLLPLTLEERVAQLSFSFEAIAPFQVSQVYSGITVLEEMTEDPAPFGTGAAVLITRGYNSSETSDPAQINEQLLRNTPDFQSIQITNQESAPFAGGTGHVISGVVGDLTAVQFLHIPDDGRYIRLVAIGATSALEPLLPMIQDVADSVEILE